MSQVQILEIQEKQIISLEEIKKIIFHRYDKLLLDEVAVTSTVEGKLLVREDICKGHKLKDGGIMKASDLYDMAAQLASVFISTLPDYSHLKGKDGMTTEYGRSKFRLKILENDTIYMETSAQNIKVMSGSKMILINGSNFVVTKEGGKGKSTIEYAKIVIPI